MIRNEVYPSRWLKAADLSPDGEQVTIRKVTMEEIGEEREKKPIMSFDDHDKELVVNVTNWDSIEELTGEHDSDKWTGHVIKLVRVRVPFGGKNVEAIRVEPADPKPRRSLPAKAKPAKAKQAALAVSSYDI
jgi:hypothetical protein